MSPSAPLPASEPVPTVYLLPSVRLPYMLALRSAIRQLGWREIVSAVFPKRGILFGTPITALHLHQLETIFTAPTSLTTFARIWWFRLVLLPALRLRGIPLVWTCHEMAAHENDPANIAARMTAFMTHWADRVIVHNRGLAKRLAHSYPQAAAKVLVLPHGDLADYYNGIRAGGVVSGERFQGAFVSIGHMRRIKGNDRLIRAFARVTDPAARLIMIGLCHEPDFRAELEVLARKDPRVTLEVRPLEEAEVVAAHDEALAAAFAFRDCPTTGSVITAMALGCAIIGPAIGHMTELADETCGWLVDQDAVEDGLVCAMAEAMSNPAATRARGKAGKALMAQQDWPTIAAAMREIYRTPRSADLPEAIIGAYALARD